MNKVITGLAIAVLIFGLLLATRLFITPVSEGADMGEDVVAATMTADNAIYNYEWFKMQYQSILALQDNIETAKQAVSDFKDMYGDDVSTWSTSDKNNYSKLTQNVTGLTQRLTTAVAEYNAKSRMANRAVFKDELPTNIIEGASQALEFSFGSED